MLNHQNFLTNFGLECSRSPSRRRTWTARASNFSEIISIITTSALIFKKFWMKSYRFIRFPSCILIIFGKKNMRFSKKILTKAVQIPYLKTNASGFLHSFSVKKINQKFMSVHVLLRDPLRDGLVRFTEGLLHQRPSVNWKKINPTFKIQTLKRNILCVVMLWYNFNIIWLRFEQQNKTKYRKIQQNTAKSTNSKT